MSISRVFKTQSTSIRSIHNIPNRCISSSDRYHHKYDLFQPYTPLETQNRIMMAPMTRNRADSNGVLSPYASIYYSQRASAGMIVSEAVNISPLAQSYCRTPGIYTSPQFEAWGAVTNAVMAENKDAQFWLQLSHGGRISHEFNRTTMQQTISPSDVMPMATVFTHAGRLPPSPPAAMVQGDFDTVLEQYYQGARRAMEAGCRGVEVHAGSGFLLHQFLSSNANVRGDMYGGSVENRCRFVLEVLDAVISAVGVENSSTSVGLRLTPLNRFNDIEEDDVCKLYVHLIKEVSKRNIAYVHVQRVFPHSEIETITESSSNLNVDDIYFGKNRNNEDGNTLNHIEISGAQSILSSITDFSDESFYQLPSSTQNDIILALIRLFCEPTLILSGGFNRDRAMNAVQPYGVEHVDQIDSVDVGQNTNSTGSVLGVKDDLYYEVLAHINEIQKDPMEDFLNTLPPLPFDSNLLEAFDSLNVGNLEKRQNSDNSILNPTIDTNISKLTKYLEKNGKSKKNLSKNEIFGNRLNSKADMVGFGALFVSNPDLPYRLQHDYSLNYPDFKRINTPGAQGYIDYLTYDKETEKKVKEGTTVQIL